MDAINGLDDKDAQIMARQGHSFVTADEVRVVHQAGEGDSTDGDLIDVPSELENLITLLFAASDVRGPNDSLIT